MVCLARHPLGIGRAFILSVVVIEYANTLMLAYTNTANLHFLVFTKKAVDMCAAFHIVVVRMKPRVLLTTSTSFFSIDR